MPTSGKCKDSGKSGSLPSDGQLSQPPPSRRSPATSPLSCPTIHHSGLRNEAYPHCRGSTADALCDTSSPEVQLVQRRSQRGLVGLGDVSEKAQGDVEVCRRSDREPAGYVRSLRYRTSASLGCPSARTELNSRWAVPESGLTPPTDARSRAAADHQGSPADPRRSASQAAAKRRRTRA